MKLLTKEIIEKLKNYPIGSQDGLGLNAKVLVKVFQPYRKRDMACHRSRRTA